jgi:hypothetical protein
MKNKDEIINDLFISCKSYANFYKKEILSKYNTHTFDIEAIDQLNQQLIYNFSLLNKSLETSIFQIFQVRKAKKQSRSYEEMNVLSRRCTNFIAKNHNKEYNIENFLTSYHKLNENLVCLIANYPFEKLTNWGIRHKYFGFVTQLELVYVIISKNYYYIDLYKNCHLEVNAVAV